MKIAVIGSGIAGLSATWFLGRSHEVTLFERGPGLGMDAYTAEVECATGSVSINAPMRVFFREYYPTLTALYETLGVEFEPVQYSGSFSAFGGDTYFRYRNFWLGARSFSMLAGSSLFSPRAIKLGAELLKFFRAREERIQQGPLDAISLEDYLRREGYSRSFSEDFLYPTFAGICTCSYQSIRDYPASMICEYLDSGLLGSRVNRLVKGTADAATRMASAAKDCQFGARLRAVRPSQTGVEVIDSDGASRRFDHVVIATQANQALELLPDECAAERRELGRFSYEQSEVLVHRDARLAPSKRSEWAPVNFLLSAEHDKPMASIWMNRIHPELRGQPDLFETWNPYHEIPADKTLLRASFERPVVSQASLQGVAALEQLHDEPDRRLWFAGSYARRGIPLLESAAASARMIASKLNSDPHLQTQRSPQPAEELGRPRAEALLDS